MTHTHYIPIRIHKFFPPDNGLAVKVARMCVLIEDLRLELDGYLAGPIKDLDSISSDFRKIYFVRNLFRTFIELKGAIEEIRKTQDFKLFLSEMSSEQNKVYEETYREFDEQYETLKGIRHDIGGHFKEEIVRKGLKRIDPFKKALWESSVTNPNTHYNLLKEKKRCQEPFMEYCGHACVLIIVLYVAFEGSSSGWNTALKFHDALSHLMACNNPRMTLFPEATDDHPYDACLLH